MQWNGRPGAGFTDGTPWIMINPNYTQINAEEQTAREDSVFHYYQRLIQLRKQYEIIVYGSCELLLPDDPDLYVYTRSLNGERLLVICNFRDSARDFCLPDGWDPDRMELLIGNCERTAAEKTMQLMPYEAAVFRMGIK